MPSISPMGSTIRLYPIKFTTALGDELSTTERITQTILVTKKPIITGPESST